MYIAGRSCQKKSWAFPELEWGEKKVIFAWRCLSVVYLYQLSCQRYSLQHNTRGWQHSYVSAGGQEQALLLPVLHCFAHPNSCTMLKHQSPSSSSTSISENPQTEKYNLPLKFFHQLKNGILSLPYKIWQYWYLHSRALYLIYKVFINTAVSAR